MRRKSFARELRSGRKLAGSWCTFASFASSEMMTRLGFDFLVFDMQHGEVAQSHFPALFGAFPADGPACLVRAPSNDYHIINWLFDQGAEGVMVPMVNSPEEARRAVEAAKFPPLGKRSFGPYRAAAYSFDVPEYMAEADSLATLIIQIEDEAATREIDAILAVPGIDAVFMGPNDLAYSMLKPGQSFFSRRESNSDSDPGKQWTAFARTPKVLELCRHARERCKAAGIPFGMTAGTQDEALKILADGADFVTLGSDFLFLRAGAGQLAGQLKERRSGSGHA